MGFYNLLEGMFDFIGLGNDNCIPLLGKVLHNKIFKTLIDKAKGYVVILLDPDAKKNAYEIYQKLDGTALRGRVRLVDLPEGIDISELNATLGRSEVLKYLRKNRKLTVKDSIKFNLK